LVINPQPAWLSILVLALPGIILAACAANQTIFGSFKQPRSTIPAMSLVIAIVPAHLMALGFGSLSYGLVVAWTPISLAGLAWGMRHRRDLRGMVMLDKSDWGRLGATVLATAPIIGPTLFRNFWDEEFIGAHHAIIAHLQNGAYPPRYLYAPWLPLRYHYAFDVAAAIITGIFRIRPDHAIDVLTLTLWPCTFLLLWRVGSCIGGRRAGPFVAFSVCFAGTLPLWCSGNNNAPLLTVIAEHVLGECMIGSEAINHPFISYFFQHPWSLGVPVFALIVLQWSAFRKQQFHAVRPILLLASLALLSLAELALLITTVVAMGLVELWRLAHNRDRRAAYILLLLAGSLPAAKLMGGFLVSGAYPSSGGFFGTGIVLRDFSSFTAVVKQLLWNVESFGPVLLLGLVGLAFVKQKQLFLATLAVIGLGIANLLRYKYTWDIAKFGSVSFIALALASGVALVEMRKRAGTVPRKLGFVAVVLVLVSQGIAFPLVNMRITSYSQGAANSIRPYFSLTFPIDRDEAAAVSYLRTHMDRSDIVFRNKSESWPYAVVGGLPYFLSFSSDSGRNDQYGLGEDIFFARADLQRISDDWVTRLSREHVNWIVSDTGETELNAVLDRARSDGTVSTAIQFCQIMINRLTTD
jgi:hypothetical protein